RGRRDVATAKLCSRTFRSLLRSATIAALCDLRDFYSLRNFPAVAPSTKRPAASTRVGNPGIAEHSEVPARQRRSRRHFGVAYASQSHPPHDHRNDPTQSFATRRIARESRKKRTASSPQDARTNACGDCPLASDDASALPLRLRQQH
ncbi:hypothetical protein, partial [Burkholderia oklahomensis]|uniref:hypothetical protein n=1 Tax=Burkholderia oklahomensis TaxID=342113 RepID=UPI001E49E770